MGIGEQYELEKTGRIEPETPWERKKKTLGEERIDLTLPAEAQFEIFYGEVAEALAKLDSSNTGLNMVGKLELVKEIIKKHGEKVTAQPFRIIEEQGPKLETTTRKMTDDNHMHTLDRANALEEYYARIYDTMIACGHNVGGKELPSILQMVCDVIKKCRAGTISGKKTIEHRGGNPIHKEFYDLIAQIVDTFQRKNNDYAGSDAQDMMQNFMRCENFGIKMSDGIITRMSDKITRMENLFRTKNQMVKDESLIDTVTDLSVYCLFLVIALKRESNAN